MSHSPSLLIARERASDTVQKLHLVAESDYRRWLAMDSSLLARKWAGQDGFKGKAGDILKVFSKPGKIESYVAVTRDGFSPANFSALPGNLPRGTYMIESISGNVPVEAVALGWAAGTYKFDKYKSGTHSEPNKLILPSTADTGHILRQANAIHWIQDQINEPANQLGVEAFSNAIVSLVSQFNAVADVKVIDNDSEFPLIWNVGKAAEEKPRLIDIRWGDVTHPLVTIIGKGVIYDSGGLSLKNLDGMVTMKKDMGGAAHAVGLASMIMDAKLPVQLHVVIPIVENAINERAFRNGDIIPSRAGKFVEIANTDAEGRLILADAITYALEDRKTPALLLDFATLTAAARTVSEPGTPVIMGSHRSLLRLLEDVGERLDDRLQAIHMDPRNADKPRSRIADLKNSGSELPSHMMAAHFLNAFNTSSGPWVHVDQSAWDGTQAKAQAVRTVYDYIRTLGPQ